MATKRRSSWIAVPSASAILAVALFLGGCAGDDLALMQNCRVADGRGNVYEATNMEMMDALEDATQQCETAAVDPATCVARGCQAAQ
jgi:hypothetical protein